MCTLYNGTEMLQHHHLDPGCDLYHLHRLCTILISISPALHFHPVRHPVCCAASSLTTQLIILMTIFFRVVLTSHPFTISTNFVIIIIIIIIISVVVVVVRPQMNERKRKQNK